MTFQRISGICSIREYIRAKRAHQKHKPVTIKKPGLGQLRETLIKMTVVKDPRD